jgi:threonine dehydrogenase-like Zn-dependent dehydrogenase
MHMKKIIANIATLQASEKLIFTKEELGVDVGPDEILCETLVSIISPGTELAAYRGAPPLRYGVTYPRLVGYCNVARVIRKGSKVTNISVGDRVLTLQSHRSHFKINSSEILVNIPSEINSRDAACGYLYHLGYNAILRGNVRLGSTIVVIGMGVLGLTTVAMAALAGGRVYGVSDYAGAIERSFEAGARGCFRRRDIEKLFSELGNERAQIVVSTTGVWSDWGIALDSAGEQGAIVVLGFPGREDTHITLNPLDSKTFYAKQLRVIAAGHSPLLPEPKGFLPFNLRDNMQRIMGWILTGHLRPSSLISGEFGGLSLQEAYQSLLRRDNAAITYALTWRDE